jgi:hypothetical protein
MASSVGIASPKNIMNVLTLQAYQVTVAVPSDSMMTLNQLAAGRVFVAIDYVQLGSVFAEPKARLVCDATNEAFDTLPPDLCERRAFRETVCAEATFPLYRRRRTLWQIS